MPTIWKPSVTVAAVIERNGLFLLIEEETSDGIRLNQPAGHLDPFESLEQAVVREARRRHVDGVICGHIHRATIEDYSGVLYCNDGDWVESCTALVEHLDGRLAIIHWADESVYLLQETEHEIIYSHRRLAPTD